jgi:arylsulfatase A-like enzyme
MKYIHCDDDLAKLYDLANDPWELENLADHPAYRVIS